MKTLIIGYGVSGKAAAKWCTHLGYEVTIVDKHPLTEEGVLSEKDVHASDFDLVIVSPGIRKTHPLFQDALDHDIPIIGEVEMGLRAIPPSKKVIGITGSNGKTTTVSMVAHILQMQGYKAPALGNIGDTICDYLLQENEADFYVCEISSYQLETMSSPVFDIVAITNITENHLDSYGSMDEYRRTKWHIFSLTKEKGQAFVSRASMPEDYRGKVNLIEDDNSAFAIAIVGALGVSIDDAKKALETFQKPPHRLQKVSDVFGITFINDSKSTTVHSTIYAVQQLKLPTILLAGGKNKGLDFDLWKKSLSPYVKKIIAFGECATKIRDDVYSGLEVEICETLPLAFAKAREFAVEGDCVLLSPGCASLDQFKNYEERGEVFTSLVHSLNKEQ